MILTLVLAGCNEDNQPTIKNLVVSPSPTYTADILVLPTAAPTATATLLFPSNQLTPLIQTNIFLLNELLSPDSKWIIESHSNFRILSTANPKAYLEDNNIGLIDSFSGFKWSPDNTSIIGIAQTNPGICATDVLIVYKIVNKNHLEKSEYHLDKPGCLDVSWSPDSSTILVHLRGTNTMVFIDQNANVLNTFELGNVDELRFDGIWWAKDGVYFITRGDHYEFGDLTIWPGQLQRLNPSSLEIESLPIRTGRPVAFSQNADKIMTVIEDKDTNILFIWNLISFDLQKTIVLPGEIRGKVFNSFNAPVVAMILGGEDTQVYLYDWDHKTLKSYGAAVSTSGWCSARHGFWVTREVHEGDTVRYVIELVKP